MMSGEMKLTWPIKDLIPNGEYYFRVQAVNKIGGGEFTELRNPVIAEDQKRTTALSTLIDATRSCLIDRFYFQAVYTTLVSTVIAA